MKHTRFFIALDLKITFEYNVQKIFLGTLFIIFTKPKKFQSTKKIATRERKSEKEEGKCNIKSKELNRLLLIIVNFIMINKC